MKYSGWVEGSQSKIVKQSLQKLFQKIINKFFVLYLTQAEIDHCNGVVI